MSVIKNWINLQGGRPRLFFLMMCMSVWGLTKAGVPWFLQFWSSHFNEYKSNKKDDVTVFLGLYMCINIIQIFCDFIRTRVIFNGNVQLSKEINFLMTFRLMHASVSKFFDRVPLGRILNRFIKDIQVVDNMLAWSTGFLVGIT
jgi:ABC-type multidrug transport system fused ATPase/permease subunit